VRLRTPRAAAAFVTLVAALVGAQVAAAAGEELGVRVRTTRIAASLGDKLRFATVVENEGSTTTPPLVAHMTVFSLEDGTYVDPEDWSSQRTKYLAPLPGAGSRAITWSVQAVNDGSFGVSIEVLPRTGKGTPAVGPTVRLDVAKRDTLDAGGILPLALGVPALLGLLTAGIRLRRRRGRPA
jgi:hypothetical protein